MTKILFVCHGNICRSPMAEFILKEQLRRSGKEDELQAASAATSAEELGNGVYPPARRKLAEHGIGCEGKLARRMTAEDYENYDLLIGMDRRNTANMLRILGGEDPEGKLHTLPEYYGQPEGEIADPWYTDDFDAAWDDLWLGCLSMMNELTDGHVTLDFSGCRDRKEMFGIIREKMLWQEWYGGNLDALWDVLTGEPHYGREFTVILPEDAELRGYGERIADLLRGAGKSVELK